MENSNSFKVVWWGLLVIVIGLFLYSRFDSLVSGNPTYFDTVVFLVWVGVCLAPIFKEMNIFGLELKQEIEELKKDMVVQLSMLKTELKATIEVSSANNNQIYVSTGATPLPPKDAEIPDLKKQVQATLQELGITSTAPTVSFTTAVEPISVELFKTRLLFEKLISNYARLRGIDTRKQPVFRIIRDLQRSEEIPVNIAHGVLEVLSVCNYGVHGEEVSEAQLGFVRESAPGLYDALQQALGVHAIHA
ncbi:hypothetical protein [Rhodoferax sp.]|uniref:hypothetical protein n=1 Tax=Rhodoferax sp. TaxID=50421 RepID=UPI00273218F1|nr:hypothetical protein [Rhodoferax sp.]MDP1530736.1 hypothetical protein [Rhodoferax sp.]MDP1942440.1 hypothetical protein [Rhodoferax sp.]MDP2441926.1 hypothetical protein [Rhodoferax sp.]MDZ4208058.1 hypothetical protein [Rhodoferax sp.]